MPDADLLAAAEAAARHIETAVAEPGYAVRVRRHNRGRDPRVRLSDGLGHRGPWCYDVADVLAERDRWLADLRGVAWLAKARDEAMH